MCEIQKGQWGEQGNVCFLSRKSLEESSMERTELTSCMNASGVLENKSQNKSQYFQSFKHFCIYKAGDLLI